jgi:hypothetical protein
MQCCFDDILFAHRRHRQAPTNARTQCAFTMQATIYVADNVIVGSTAALMYLQPGIVVYSSVYETLASEGSVSAFRKLVDAVPGMSEYLSNPAALITLFARACKFSCSCLAVA